ARHAARWYLTPVRRSAAPLCPCGYCEHQCRPPAAAQVPSGQPRSGPTPRVALAGRQAPSRRQRRPRIAALCSAARRRPGWDCTTENGSPFVTTPDFARLGVPSVLIGALAPRGIVEPTPIQAATLPDSLTGRDVLGRGRTGSGKTYAFLLPLVARLIAEPRRRVGRRPRSLVLAPTRELAAQLAESLAPLEEAAGLRSTVVFGGVGQNPQVKALAGGVDVLVACPGRLLDLMNQGHVDLGGVEITVIDEADHMADMGFLPMVRRILAK